MHGLLVRGTVDTVRAGPAAVDAAAGHLFSKGARVYVIRNLLTLSLVLLLSATVAAAQVGGMSSGHRPSPAEQALAARYEVARATVAEVIREMRLYLVRLEADYTDAVQALRGREAAAAVAAKRKAEAQAAAKAAEPKADAVSTDAAKAVGK